MHIVLKWEEGLIDEWEMSYIYICLFVIDIYVCACVCLRSTTQETVRTTTSVSAMKP